MNDDYKKGLITGLAMQPLYVAEGGSSDGFCDTLATIGVKSDEGYCKYIDFEE